MRQVSDLPENQLLQQRTGVNQSFPITILCHLQSVGHGHVVSFSPYCFVQVDILFLFTPSGQGVGAKADHLLPSQTLNKPSKIPVFQDENSAAAPSE